MCIRDRHIDSGGRRTAARHTAAPAQVLIMFVFPKMMQNMDPEQLKEMQQMQGGLADMLNPEKQRERLEEKGKEKPATGSAKRAAKAGS